MDTKGGPEKLSDTGNVGLQRPIGYYGNLRDSMHEPHYAQRARIPDAHCKPCRSLLLSGTTGRIRGGLD